MTRIGLVGCGYWGRNILRDLRQLGCLVDVAVPGDAQAIDGARAVVPSVGALDVLLDGFVVATPSPTHEQIVRELLPRGKPIFCEKPLTVDAASARSLARDAGNLLFVMHKWAYHGGIQALAALARSGELGAVNGVFTRRLQWGKPQAPVDPVWELAVHDLTIVRAILGRIPPVRIARGIERDNKMHGVIAVLGDTPFAHIEVGSHWPKAERMTRVYFEHGIGMLDDPFADHIEVIRGGAPDGERREPQNRELRVIDVEWPLLKELRAFVNHLRGGAPPATTAAEGAEVVAALEAIRAAAAAAEGRIGRTD